MASRASGLATFRFRSETTCASTATGKPPRAWIRAAIAATSLAVTRRSPTALHESQEVPATIARVAATVSQAPAGAGERPFTRARIRRRSDAADGAAIARRPPRR